ncbi:FHA domain-containing protein [Lentisphaerota bacterium ZTH]|nr:FHA domain-containing protein [Lentisphaerota bacterium]WET06857.1 FHA domain-containing protein [Lentisphaerota bacterium ZTH]
MKIFFLDGIRAGESVDLQKAQITLGRELDNDINILAEGVSRYHARIDRLNDNSRIIIDLGSTNGIKVNKEKISGSRKLKSGDVIELGDQSFKLAASDGESTENNKVENKKNNKKRQTDKKPDSSAAPLQVTSPSAHDGEPDNPPMQKIIFKPMPAEPVEKNNKSPSSTKNKEPAKEADLEQSGVEKEKSRPKNTAEISESMLKDLDIFNKTASRKNESTPKAGSKKRRHSSNLLFYTSVVCFAAVFIAIFYGYNKHKSSRIASAAKPAQKKLPFVLYYVKEKATIDNVFRFSVLIELDKVIFTIDDLKSERHFSKTIDKINESKLEALKKEINRTSFMKLEQATAGNAVNNLDETRLLSIVSAGKTNTINVCNTFAPTSFETIESAINDLSDFYGMHSIALTPEELKKLAEEMFHKAEDCFQNREADPANLLKAIRRYRLAIEYLDQFSPKPEIWNIARKREQEAEAMRQARLSDLKFEFKRMLRLKDYTGARTAAEEAMKLSSEDEKMYHISRKAVMQIDQYLRKRNK